MKTFLLIARIRNFLEQLNNNQLILAYVGAAEVEDSSCLKTEVRAITHAFYELTKDLMKLRGIDLPGCALDLKPSMFDDNLPFILPTKLYVLLEKGELLVFGAHILAATQDAAFDKKETSMCKKFEPMYNGLNATLLTNHGQCIVDAYKLTI